MLQSNAIWTYRLYLRDAHNQIVRSDDVDLASDEDARQLVDQMLRQEADYSYADVWDGARLVCMVRKRTGDKTPANPPLRR